MTRAWVKDLQMGQEVNEVFAATTLQLRTYSNGEFLSMRLADKTGKISAVYWSGSQELLTRLQHAALIRVKGRVKEYQGSAQITVQEVAPVGPEETIDESDFLPVSPIEPEVMIERLQEWKASLSTEYHRRLWDLFFEDHESFDRFASAPGGKLWHHSYLAGLLEHTESLIRLCSAIAEVYPCLNRDLLLSGALFHDLGKAWELIYRTTFDYSDEGRLIGHIVMGYEKVQRYLEQIPEFPREEALLLQHMILSHQGETPESPRLPRCREAMALHSADMIDSQLAAFTREMEKPEAAGQNWTGYVNLIGRHLYRGTLNDNGANP